MIFDWDDAWPGHDRLDLLERLHAMRPDFRCTLFAVPGRGTDDYWNSFPDWCELAVHGWKHPHPRECEDWTYRRAFHALDNKPERFVEGWKSPGWQVSEGTYWALMDGGWWIADHPDNNHRRPEGLKTHVVGGSDHWHGHIGNDCGNGLEETWDTVVGLVTQAASFELISECVAPWVPDRYLVST